MRLVKNFVFAIPFFLTAGAALADNLVTAVLPSSRSTTYGKIVTVFDTVINASGHALHGCQIQGGTDGSGRVTLGYRLTDPTTNAVVGLFDPLFDMDMGSSQSLVLTLYSSDLLDSAQVRPIASCVDPINGEDVSRSIDGLNTILFSTSPQPTPDIIALSATTTGDGIVHIQGNGSNAFAVAVANVGVGDVITASADTGDLALPLTASICQTDGSGQCMKPPALSVDLTIPANGTASFGIFVYANGELPLDPANARIVVRYYDSAHKVRGATSVAVGNTPTFTATLPKGGIFLGTSKTSNGNQGFLSGTDVLFLGEDGEVQGFDEQGNILSGNLTIGQNLGLSGTTIYQQADGPQFAFYDWAGTLAQHSWFAAELVSRGNSLATFVPGLVSLSGNYQVDPYERGSSLSSVAGAWNIRDPSGSAIGTVSFTNAGVYTGTVSGCSFKGQIALINPHYNIYRMALNFQNCRPGNGLLSGLAGLGAVIDDRSRNDTLIFIGNNATYGNGFAISFVRY